MRQRFLLAVATNRHRYWFAVFVYACLIIAILWMCFTIQHDLTLKEQQSAVSSATMSFSKSTLGDIVDIPYHILQKISLHFFGITSIGVKLPSLFIGAAIGIMIVLLLKRWLMRPSIALFASLIAITNTQIIVMSASGTPLIMTIFWAILVLLTGLRLVSKPKSLLWSTVATIVVALSLYTPLGIYMAATLVIVGLLHPHLRQLLIKMPLRNILICIVLALIITLPLVLGIWYDSSQLWQLLGWPGQAITPAIIQQNIIIIIKMYFNFWYGNITAIGMSPVFNIASLCLVILGGLRLVTNLHAARSYGLLMLFPVLLLPVILQPMYITILFVPLILLLSIGIEALLDEWYKLFPFNPYARIVALVPLIVLLSGVIISNLTFYTNTFRYNGNLSRYYSQDLTLIRPLLAQYQNPTVVTSELEKPFYDLLRRDFPDAKISTTMPPKISRYPLIITPGTGISRASFGTPDRIVTDRFKERTPRLYVYTHQADN